MTSKKPTFLYEVAEKIVQENEDLRKVLIILPNRRASQYLNKSIAQVKQKASWLPKTETLSNWIVQGSDKKVMASTESLFVLYQAYEEVYPDPDPFAEFFKWGQMILNDFNEVDRYLLDPDSVFKNLLDIQALESWNIESSEISKTQEQFHEFWLLLKPLYEKFHALLSEQNYTTSSHLFRTTAQDINTIHDLTEDFNNVYFVGFNALSKAEELIFNHIIKMDKGHICVDADIYYTGDAVHEAGHFYRKIASQWGNKVVSEPINRLGQNKIHVDVVGSPTTIGQVNAAMLALEKIPQEEYADTVVVLADEDLIWPTLSALPPTIGNVNVTMGVALKWTPLQSLLNAILELQQSHIRMKNKNGVYFQALLPVLQHSLLQHIAKKDLAEAVNTIVAGNQIYIQLEELKDYFEDDVFSILEPWKDWNTQPIQQLKKLAQWVLKNIDDTSSAPLEKEMVFLFIEHLKKLEKIIRSLPFSLDSNVFKKLFFQYWHEARIDLKGDPIDEIQLMGMLETRSLSFKNVIILGLNEGTFPKTKKEYSVIPYDLKQFFNLPTKRDRDAIFANHFYRLIQRAENLVLTYGTAVEGIQENEKSRYLTQLQYELEAKNANAKLNEHFHTPHTERSITVPNQIEKTPKDVAAILQHLGNGLSPSAFNTYLTCPMDYYYKYVLRLAEEEEVEEEISNASFGTIVHNVLEELFSNFIGKQVQKEDVIAMCQNFETTLQEEFQKVFKSNSSYSYGINKISYDVSKTYIEKFLDTEIDRFDNIYKDGLIILSLEEKYESEIKFTDLQGKEQKVTIGGKFDRVDQVGDSIRIIDYKTGMVKDADTKLDVSKFDQKSPKTKAHQLMLYVLMYPERSEKIEAGIFSMRNLDAGLITLNFDNNSDLDDAAIQQYKSFLRDVFKNMTDSNRPFEHNPDSKYCERCVI